MVEREFTTSESFGSVMKSFNCDTLRFLQTPVAYFQINSIQFSKNETFACGAAL